MTLPVHAVLSSCIVSIWRAFTQPLRLTSNTALLTFFRCICSFERQNCTERRKDRKKRAIPSTNLLSKMAIMVWVEPGWSQKLEFLLECSHAKTQVLGPFSAALPCALAGSWIENRASWSHIGTHMGCWYHREELNAFTLQCSPYCYSFVVIISFTCSVTAPLLGPLNLLSTLSCSALCSWLQTTAQNLLSWGSHLDLAHGSQQFGRLEQNTQSVHFPTASLPDHRSADPAFLFCSLSCSLWLQVLPDWVSVSFLLLLASGCFTYFSVSESYPFTCKSLHYLHL